MQSDTSAPAAQFLLANSRQKRAAILSAHVACGRWRPGLAVVPIPAAGSLDVRAIRLASRGVGATQETFANAIGVPVTRVRYDWAATAFGAFARSRARALMRS
jgi:hypothetical protein